MSHVPVVQEKNTRPAVADSIITGFHAVEEYIRHIAGNIDRSDSGSAELLYCNPGPRVKKICVAASAAGISCTAVEKYVLDKLTSGLNGTARDHRGLVLKIAGGSAGTRCRITLDSFLADIPEKAVVLILDSVTDPHNVGAVIRSCDQFGVALVILPERRGVKDPVSNEVVARASAGAVSWVPVAVVPNLNRAVRQLKDAGFWIYGADAGGTSVADVEFPSRTVLVMGSEGNGISRLLEESCDSVVSIPTRGRLDSLNVSVAAGIFLYEISRQQQLV